MKITDSPQPQEPVDYHKLTRSRLPLRTTLRQLLKQPYPRNKLYKVYGKRAIQEVITSMDIHQTRLNGKIHWQWFNPSKQPREPMRFVRLSD